MRNVLWQGVGLLCDSWSHSRDRRRQTKIAKISKIAHRFTLQHAKTVPSGFFIKVLGGYFDIIRHLTTILEITVMEVSLVKSAPYAFSNVYELILYIAECG